MNKMPPKLIKRSLHKDLDRLTFVERATQHVTKTLAPYGLALLFLVAAGLIALAFTRGDAGDTVMVVAAVGLAAYMAMNIGANDVTNNVGAAVGARAISLSAALVMAAVFEIAGAMIAGSAVTHTIATGIVSPDQVADPQVFIRIMMAALLAAALWINLATWMNAPISTTHSIVGSVIGAGAAALGSQAVNWASIAAITLGWLVSPVLGGLIAAATLWLIYDLIVYRADKIDAARRWVPVLIGVMAGAFACFLLLTALGEGLSLSARSSLAIGAGVGVLVWLASIPVIRRQSLGLENRNQSLRRLFRLPLIGAAALLSFAHGANDVSNAIGPLTGIVHISQGGIGALSQTVPAWVVTIGALGISVGLLLFGPRLIRLVGSKITKLNPMRAYCVALSSALTVIAASWLGLPVSSTHIAIGAVFGVGLFREYYTRTSTRRLAYLRLKSSDWMIDDPRPVNPDELRRRRLVRRSHMLTILGAWMVTLPVSAGLAALTYRAMAVLFG